MREQNKKCDVLGAYPKLGRQSIIFYEVNSTCLLLSPTNHCSSQEFLSSLVTHCLPSSTNSLSLSSSPSFYFSSSCTSPTPLGMSLLRYSGKDLVMVVKIDFLISFPAFPSKVLTSSEVIFQQLLPFC